MLNLAVLSTAGVLLCLYAALKLKRRQRRFKIRPINRVRKLKGSFNYYLSMKAWDSHHFFKFTRMTVPVFEKLLSLVKRRITRQHRSDGICAEQRLVITLQYLSQGMTMQSLAWNFQIGHTSVQQIVHETCKAIWEVLSPEYLKSPFSGEDWLNIANDFEQKWNFPHCLGAVDGKHVNIQAPAKSRSLYYNYKKQFSIVLLAACDSKYRFTLVDIGAYGSQSDGGIFRNSVFGQRLDNDIFNVPKSTMLEGSTINMPYFLVGDEAFPLKPYIMRPYGGKHLSDVQRVFNYRLSRARQVLENTFGVLVARWRILKTSINALLQNADNIIKAVVVLHNYCQIELTGNEENMYCPPGFVDSDDQENGLWRGEQTPLQSVGRLAANYAKRNLYETRNILADYFISARGQVPSQNKKVNEGLILRN